MRPLVTSLAISLLLISSAAQTTAGKPRVFISDSQSWEMSGNAGGANGTFAAHSSGGARPQTAEIVKTFGERCSDVIVNNKPDKADYVVLLDHEGGKGLIKRDNKMAVFNKDGDSIVSHSTRSLGNSVKDACDAITADWTARSAKNAASTPAVQPASAVARSMETSSASKISVSSTPANADIEIDGSFVGSTPSLIEVTSGEHSVVVKKTGYKNWERKLRVTGGSISVSAELEKVPISENSERGDVAPAPMPKEIDGIHDSSIGASAAGNAEARHDGVELSSVVPGGPADQAGLKSGDVILAIGGRFLFTINELNEEIRHYSPGSRVALRYRRHSTIYDGNLTIGEAATRPH